MSAAEIIVATAFGPLRVVATVTTHLAVHRGLTDGWALSHRATGCKLRTFTSKKRALEVANVLERECGDDLNAMARMRFATKARPATRGKWKSAGARLKAALAKAVQQ